MEIKGVFRQIKKQIKSHNPQIILFGETHGYLDELPLQEKIVSYFKPNALLLELFENKTLKSSNDYISFLLRNEEEDFSIISKIAELKHLAKMGDKSKLPIIGIDLEAMGRQNTDFRTKTSLTPKEEEFEMRLLKKREAHQAKMINATSGKAFVSVGAYHLRDGSFLIKNLEKSCLIVLPSFEGNPLFEPTNEIPKSQIIFTSKFVEL